MAEPVSGRVVVVGGGNVAIDVARTAARLGAESVDMLCLEARDIMPASNEEVAEAESDGVRLSCGWGPAEVLAQNGHVTGVRFKRCTSVFDDEGRFAPTYDEADTIDVACDQLVLSIGQSIEWGNLLEGSAVELGRGQGAVADPKTYQTAEPDLFVGGDVYTGPKFAIDAIAAGHEAAVSIHRFVQGGTLTIGRNPRSYRELNRDDIEPGSYDTTSRQEPAIDHERERTAPFEEYAQGFTEEQVARPPAAWAAAPRSSMPTSALVAACARPSVPSTPSTSTASAPSAPRWSSTRRRLPRCSSTLPSVSSRSCSTASSG